MLNKFSALRLIATSSFLFLSLVLFSFSCQDHPIPEEPRVFPIIHTEEAVRENANPDFKYSVQFGNLGNQEVIEYGVVTYAGSANEVITPTVPVVDNLKGRKYAFSGPGYMPPNLDMKSIVKMYDGPSGQIRLFYRAYAITTGNNIVYGQTLFLDFFAQPSQPTPANIETVSSVFNNDGNIGFFSLEFTTLGNIPIDEYGMVYIETSNANANLNPTINNNKYVFQKQAITGVVSQAVNISIGGKPIYFYRAYVKLNNGNVIYGDVKKEAAPLNPLFDDGNIQNLGSSLLLTFNFSSLGTKVIKEYGYVYIYNSSLLDNVTPTINDKKIKILVPPAIGYMSVDSNNNEETDATGFSLQSDKVLHFRAYVLLGDGTVLYGKTQVK